MKINFRSKTAIALSTIYFLLIIVIGVLQEPFCSGFEGKMCQIFDFYPLVPLIYFIPHRFWYIAAIFNILLIYFIVVIISSIFSSKKNNISQG